MDKDKIIYHTEMSAKFSKERTMEDTFPISLLSGDLQAMIIDHNPNAKVFMIRRSRKVFATFIFLENGDRITIED